MPRRTLGPVTSQSPPGAEGVLITGVYGSGKSSVAAEIAHLLEQRRRPYALLDLDYLGWGGTDDVAAYFLMLRNLAAVAGNYREAGVGTFVVAWFVRDQGAVAGGPPDRAAGRHPAAPGRRPHLGPSR
jgi:hypothetical protein